MSLENTHVVVGKHEGATAVLLKDQGQNGCIISIHLSAFAHSRRVAGLVQSCPSSFITVFQPYALRMEIGTCSSTNADCYLQANQVYDVQLRLFGKHNKPIAFEGVS